MSAHPACIASSCSIVRRARRASCALSTFVLLGTAALGQGRVQIWGDTDLEFGLYGGPAVAFDASSSLVLLETENGSLATWGNIQGDHPVPPVVPAGRSVIDITAGYSFSAVVLDDGTIAATGSDDQGQLQVPPLPPGVQYTQVASGSYFALALRSDGNVVSWGEAQGTAPSLPPGLHYVQVDALHTVAAALRSDGAIVLWGGATAAQQAVPTPPPGKSFVRVAAGGAHALGLLSDGSVLAWGSNQHGQLDVPALPPGTRYLDVRAGSSNSIALRSDGQVMAWGLDNVGQSDVPPLPAGTKYVAIASDSSMGAAMRDDGDIVVWGITNHGAPDWTVSGVRPRQVALPSLTGLVLRNDGVLSRESLLANPQGLFMELFPQPPPGLVYTDIEGSGFSALAVRSDGALVTLGGPLQSPAFPPPGVSYTKASWGVGSGLFLVALRSDGKVDGWGDNSNGEIEVPDAPPGLSYVDVDAGNEFTAVLRSDGQIFLYGHLPNGLGSIPELPPGRRYVRISAEHFSISALRDDGQIVAWGWDFYGQNTVPPLPPGRYYVDVATSGSHTIARRSDGAAAAWGWNGMGQTDVPPLAPGQACSGVAAAWWVSAISTQPATSGSTSVYCAPGAPNSVSPGGAVLELAGNANHEFNNSLLAVRDVPPNNLGLYLYAPQQANVPFGNGVLCLGGGLQRIQPPAFSDASGRAVRFLDLQSEALSTGAGAIAPGSTWNFQYWYRDPAAPPAQFNLSSAIQVVIAP